MKRVAAWLYLWIVISFLAYAFGKPVEFDLVEFLGVCAAIALTFVACRGIVWAAEAVEGKK